MINYEGRPGQKKNNHGRSKLESSQLQYLDKLVSNLDEGSPNLVVPEYYLLSRLGLNCKHLQGSFVQIAPLESLVFAMQTGKETVHRLKKHPF